MKYNPKYRGQWSFDGLKEFAEVGAPESKSPNGSV